MKSKIAWGAAAVATIVTSGAVAFAVAGDDFPGTERTVEDRVQVGPIVARERGPVVRDVRGKPTIGSYFAQTPTVPPEGGGSVVEIRCPPRTGAAIGGGARTSVGIVLSYLSKGSPQGDTSKRGYYVGVDDNSATNQTTAGALVEVQCAKDIRVR